MTPTLEDRLRAASLPLLRSEEPAGSEVRDVEVTGVATPDVGGFSNGTWLFRVRWYGAAGPRSRDLVLRTPAAGPPLLHVPTLDLQADVMVGLAGTSVPVPRMLWRGEEAGGSPYVLMERVAGRPGADSPPYTRSGWIVDLAPAARRRVHEAAIEAMAAVHAVDVATLDAPALPRPVDPAAALEERLAFYAAHHDHAARELGRANPHVERGLEWLRANRPADPAAPVLTWGDSRIGNVLFAESGTAVVALLDWEFACVASPAHDVAHWLFADRYFTEGIGVPRPEGFPTPAEQLAHYRDLTGAALDDLPYYEVALATQSAINTMRVATMALQAGRLAPDPGLGIETGSSLILRRLLGDAVEGVGTHFAKG